MGSVQSCIPCPRCGLEEMLNDYYYRSGEEYNFCPDCGYSHVFHMKRVDGKVQFKEGTKDETLANAIWIEETVSDPYCAFRIEYVDSGGAAGSIPTEADYYKFLTDIMGKKHIKSVEVSMFVDGKIKKEVICTQ